MNLFLNDCRQKSRRSVSEIDDRSHSDCIGVPVAEVRRLAELVEKHDYETEVTAGGKTSTAILMSFAECILEVDFLNQCMKLSTYPQSRQVLKVKRTYLVLLICVIDVSAWSLWPRIHHRTQFYVDHWQIASLRGSLEIEK